VYFTNTAVKFLALTFLIEEAGVSNLALETGYADGGFLWFCSVLPGKHWDNDLN
jgi:hypothetical protein